VKIFGFLKKAKMTVLIVVLLLIIQAVCDLSLPTYTSNIVDVGIQQGGIPNAVPTQIRAETLANIELFMPDSDVQTVESHYIKGDDNIYRLNTSDKDTISALDVMFGKPITILMGIESGEQMGMKTDKKLDISQIKAAVDAGMMSKDALLEMVDSAIPASIKDLMSNPKLINQRAVQFIKTEYQAIGIDTDKLQTDYLFSSGLQMLGVVLISVLTAIVGSLLASRAAAKIAMDLRGSVFKRVVSFSSQELDKFSTASLITRTTNDIQQVQMVLVMIMRIVLYSPILAIGGVIKVINTRTGMGWIIGVAVGVIALVMITTVVIAMPKFKIMQKLIDKLNLVSREILSGIPVIRAFSREKYEEKRFEGASLDLMKTQLFTNRVMTFLMPIIMLLMNGVALSIVWFGAHGIDSGTMQVGDMMAFINYSMMIIMSFMMFTAMSIMVPRASVAADRIMEVLNAKPVIVDAPKVLDDQLTEVKGTVAFEDVSFSYPGDEKEVLQHVSFTAQPGKTTAVIGSTGSGKSTIINLILRFYEVTGGRITLDGIDIREISQKKLRRVLGYVPQKGILFSGDISSNIKFGGDDISDDAMLQAASIAQAKDFISQKADQYHHAVAQGGTNVSGGQKQRLSIARAIAKDPKVYLFDDSFSALDYKTDVTLRRALNEAVKDATVIIVAQRISTVLHADQILVLDEGKVAGIGTHDELMKTCETYREIARSQLSEKELGMEGGDAQ
jgi:ATP-binding cassette subfamily B multidrug efflux pump